MFISTRYLLKQLFLSTFSISFILSGAIWLTQSLRFIDVVINKGLPFTTFAKLTLYLFPDIFGVILPIAFFIGILFTYNKLENDHELIIYRAVGLSDLKLAAPVFILGGGLTLFLYYVTLTLMPQTLQQFRDMEHTVRSQASAIFIQEGQFKNLDGITLFVRSQKPGGSLEGILIHDARKSSQSSTIIAEKGYLTNTPQGLQLSMSNGNRQHQSKKTGQPEFIYFDDYTVNLTQHKQNRGKRNRKPYEMSLGELFYPSNPNTLEGKKMIVEGHKRLVTPLLTVVFGLVGISIMVLGEFSRRRRLKRILAAVSCVLGLQLLVLALLNLSDKLTWLIPLIYGLVGAFACFFFGLLKWHWKIPTWLRVKT